MGGGSGYGLMVIIGPIILAAVLLFAVIRNRRSSKANIARTEAATRDLYQAEDATATARDEAVRR